jgi:hypothetical protein
MLRQNTFQEIFFSPHNLQGFAAWRHMYNIKIILFRTNVLIHELIIFWGLNFRNMGSIIIFATTKIRGFFFPHSIWTFSISQMSLKRCCRNFRTQKTTTKRKVLFLEKHFWKHSDAISFLSQTIFRRRSSVYTNPTLCWNAMRLRCVCDAFAMHLRFICDVFAMHLRCVCDAFAMRLQCICDAFAMHLRCVCDAYAMGLRWVWDAFAMRLRC